MAPRLLIFGTGGVGAVYTYLISRIVPESNIVAVCRSNYSAASSHGFIINSTAWGNNLNVRPAVVKTIEEAIALDERPFDYIVICAKVIDSTPSIAEKIGPAVSKNTTIVLVQNGITIEEPYAKLYPSNAILSTVIYLPVTQTAPAVIAHKEVNLMHVGTYPADAPEHHKAAAAAFVDLITQSGGVAKLHDDVQCERWSKLLLNVPWNPICALTRLRDVPFVASSPGALQLVKDLMMEIVEVAQAYGYTNVNEDVVKSQIDRLHGRTPPGIEPSMMADALAGRSMEVDAILGNTLKLAEAKSINTPLLRTIFLLITALDASFKMNQ